MTRDLRPTRIPFPRHGSNVWKAKGGRIVRYRGLHPWDLRMTWVYRIEIQGVKVEQEQVDLAACLSIIEREYTWVLVEDVTDPNVYFVGKDLPTALRDANLPVGSLFNSYLTVALSREKAMWSPVRSYYRNGRVTEPGEARVANVFGPINFSEDSHEDQ